MSGQDWRWPRRLAAPLRLETAWRWTGLPTAWLAAVVLWLGLAAGTAAAGTVYKLQIGDSLSITVAGFPELSQRVAIQTDGAITDALLGRVIAAGSDIAELQSRMRGLLAGRVYQKMIPTGQTVAVRISPDSLTLDVASYRPVYIDGDVAKPGELSFRPGLSVRQAIALAGGYDMAKGRLTESERFLQSADLRGEIQRLTAARRATVDKITELRIVLGQDKTADTSPRLQLKPSSDGTALFELLAGSITRQMAITQGEIGKDKSYRELIIRQADEQLRVLRERQVQENDGMQSDLADYEKLHALLRQGNVTLLRVADARRSWQLSASQSLQTTSRISDVELELTKAIQELDRLESHRQVELEAQLSDLLLLQASNDSRLTAVQEKLRYLGGLQGLMANGRVPVPAVIEIHRQSSEGAEDPIMADGKTGLVPGDVVEVRLGTADAYAALGQ